MKSRQWVGVVVVVVCLGGLLSVWVRDAPSAAPPAVEDTSVSPIVTTPQPRESEVTVSVAPDIMQTVTPSEVQRLVIPGVLSARFGGAIRPNAENALVPPSSTEVFRWAERGQPGCPGRDTVFLLGHTVRAGGGVFDELQTVRRGQKVILKTETGSIRYSVESTDLYDKTEITRMEHIYARQPGRLVIVGCYLNPDGSLQTKNFVVMARAESC